MVYTQYLPYEMIDSIKGRSDRWNEFLFSTYATSAIPVWEGNRFKGQVFYFDTEKDKIQFNKMVMQFIMEN